MSWELEVDIDMARLADAAPIVARLRALLSGACGPATVTRKRGTWPDEEIVMVAPLDDVQLERLCDAVAATADYLEVDLWLQSHETAQHAVRALVYVFGDGEPGMGEIRRRAPVVLAFGNRLAWQQTRLRDGTRLDEGRFVRLLTQLCDLPVVQSLRVGCEEQVSIPFNDHLVFHRDVDGFRQDLCEIAAHQQRGGRDFADARKRYPPLRSDVAGNTMLFARRRGARLRDLQCALRDHEAVLRALDRGAPLSPECVETAALSADRLQPLNTTTGLGVVAVPFLRDYCEPLYLHMLEHLSASIAQHAGTP